MTTTRKTALGGTGLALTLALLISAFAPPDRQASALTYAVEVPRQETTAPPHEAEVGDGGNSFSPQNLTINVGDTVRWEWRGDAHSVTSGKDAAGGLFDSGLRNEGATFEHTFPTAGTYDYHCVVHQVVGMVGTVIVEERLEEPEP